MKTIFKPRKGYAALHANNAEGVSTDQIKSAFTLAMAMVLGLVKVKGEAVVTTGKAQDIRDMRDALGPTAVSYWVKQGLATRNYSADDIDTWAVSDEGAKLFSERLQGRSRRQAFNTSRRAVQIVAGYVRNGKGDADIGFDPQPVKIR